MTKTPDGKLAAAVELGTRGGRTKTPAKSAAARRNGKKGGRPPLAKPEAKPAPRRAPGRPRRVRLDF